MRVDNFIKSHSSSPESEKDNLSEDSKTPGRSNNSEDGEKTPEKEAMGINSLNEIFKKQDQNIDSLLEEHNDDSDAEDD
jgi:hypothetical protein